MIYPICSVVAAFKMLVRILNALRSRIWDISFFLFNPNPQFRNMEYARRKFYCRGWQKKKNVKMGRCNLKNYAFANCKNLKTIEIRTTKLKNKKISSKAFKKINKKVVIRVLKKQRKAYKTLLRKKGLSKANKFKAL